MNKEVKETPVTNVVAKTEAPSHPKPALDSAILDAINQAVMGAVKTIVEQVKTVPAPQSPVSAPTSAYGAPPAPPSNQPYVPKLKGIPVEPGQDLRHVHPTVIQGWFDGIENRWKQRMRERGAANGTQANVGWTRG